MAPQKIFLPDPLYLTFSEADNLEKLVKKNLDGLTLNKKIIYYILFSSLEDSEREILALINILERNDLFELAIDLLERIEVIKIKVHDKKENSFEKFKYFLSSFHILEPSEKIIDFISNLLKNKQNNINKDLDFYLELFLNDIKLIKNENNADKIMVRIISFICLRIIQLDDSLIDKTTALKRINKIRGVLSDEMVLFNYITSLNINYYVFD